MSFESQHRASCGEVPANGFVLEASSDEQVILLRERDALDCAFVSAFQLAFETHLVRFAIRFERIHMHTGIEVGKARQGRATYKHRKKNNEPPSERNKPKTCNRQGILDTTEQRTVQCHAMPCHFRTTNAKHSHELCWPTRPRDRLCRRVKQRRCTCAPRSQAAR